LIDAHCHPTPQRIEAARKDGVTRWVASAVQPEDLDKTGQDTTGVWWTAGIHPWQVGRAELSEALQALERRLQCVVAIGELGLDHAVARTPSARAAQRDAFREQLALARDHELPIVLHVVRAHGSVLKLLQDDGLPTRGGLVHGFTGAPEVAQAYLRLGLHLGLGATATNPRARRLHTALPGLPQDRIVVETDDSPVALSAIVAAVADARSEPASQTARYTSANAEALFGLP
jgi:TatD DNase family protein